MGCSESKERLEQTVGTASTNPNDLGRRSEGEVGPMSPRMAAPPVGEPEPGEDRRRKTAARREKLFSTMPKTSYNTHTTASSSYQGSNPRSDGGSDIGNMSQHSSFSRRSAAGVFGGEECLEEVSSEESDFEDDEEQAR